MGSINLGGGRMIRFWVAMILVTAMALVVVGYLFDIYSKASLIVAVLATLIVAATIAIPYKAAQRMCARKAERLAAARPD
jgi:glycerol-3-phosphate acyltransferase PlsY